MDRSELVGGLIGFSIVLAFSAFVYISHWPDLKGVVLSKWITYETTEGEIVASEERCSSGKIPKVKAFIEYLYQVDGHPYFSHQVNFDRLSLRNTDKYLSKYPTNKLVTVYYEKGNPSFSVLEPEKRSLRVLLGPILVTFILISYIFLWVFCKRFRWCTSFEEWVEGFK